MNSAIKKFLNIILRVAISLAILYFLFRKIDKDAFLQIIKFADLNLLILSFCLFTFCYLMGVLRWSMLLKGVEVSLPFKKIFTGYCGGIFFNIFMPSTIGGDLVRSLDLASHSKKPKEVIASVLLDRLSGYSALVIIAVLALLVGFNIVKDRTVILIIGLAALFLFTILLILFNNYLFSKFNTLFKLWPNNKLITAIRNLHEEIYYFRAHKMILIRNLSLSLFMQLCFPLVIFLIAEALGANINLIYFFIFIPLITAITFLPISIGGLGLRDATTVFFFAKAGLSQDISLAISLTNFTFVIFIGCIGGIVYVFTLHSRRLQRNKKL